MNVTIKIDLSPQGIERAIRKFEKYRDRIEDRTNELIQELVDGGTEMAQFAFGSTANVEKTADNGTGSITATGKNVIIMEYGAGIATYVSHPLAGNAPVPIREWSYSELVGSGEGFALGYWHFAGRVHYQVEPRHGMLDARDYIVNNLESKARTVFSR